MASAFKLAVLKSENPDDDMMRTRGENAHPALTVRGLGNTLLALYDEFFQGISEDALRDGLRLVIDEARQNASEEEKREQLINLFVLAFNTRWCRGGKGAKLAFYQCMKILYEEFPVVVIEVLCLIPQYGYWKDLLLLVEEVHTNPSVGVNYDSLVDAVWQLYATQLLKDHALLLEHRAAGTVPSLSFAAKYAPRKGHHMDKALHAVRCIAHKMFPEDRDAPPAEGEVVATADVVVDMASDDEDGVMIGEDGEEVMEVAPVPAAAAPTRPKQRYRQVVSALTAALDIPEVKMCSHRYAEINIAAIPSKCLSRNQRAFANESSGGAKRGHDETGDRFPDDPDRVECRKHLIKTLVHGKVKGGQNYPHEYVEKVQKDAAKLSTVDRMVINAQWSSMREGVLKMIADRVAANQKAAEEAAASDSSVTSALKPVVDGAGNFTAGNIIPLSDVSGSMSGTPMSVSIGLGILLSEMANGPFRDLVMTFSTDARWENLSDCSSFTEKVSKLQSAHWEGGTNFYNALNRVAAVVRENRLKQEEIPNLLVISDMQFDIAGGYGSPRHLGARKETAGGKDWNVAYENIEKVFRELGESLHGEPLTPPLVIFWNVRADSPGFPVSADQKGVMLLSGYSPALMKFVLSGELEQEVEVIDDEAEAQEAGGSMEEGAGSGDAEGLVEVKKKKVKVQLSPAETLDRVLHEEALNPVREVLAGLSDGALQVRDGALLTGHPAPRDNAVGGREGRGGGRGGRGRGRGRGRR